MSRPVGVTRVAIVEDHRLLAESMEIALTLEGHDPHRIALPTGRNAEETLLSAILKSEARVVLLDLDLGATGSGLNLIRPLHRSGVAVVVVTSESGEVRQGECLEQGARIVLDKGEPLNTVLATVRRVTEGRALVPLPERTRLIALYRAERTDAWETRTRLAGLTPREKEVLGHLMLGRPVKEISQVFVVSEATVRTQVKSILAKLEVSSQLAAVGAAHRAGWRSRVGGGSSI